MNAERERQKLLHEYDGRALIKHCVKHGATTRNGAGDHVVVCAPSGKSEVIPSRTIGHGLQCKIVKWIFAAGLAVISVVVLIPAFAH
jgi:hypothetical protein